MVKYNPIYSPRFVVYPTEDIKLSVVWYYKEERHGFECFSGTVAKCMDFIKEKMKYALHHDMISTTNGADAVWWDVINITNNWTIYEIQEHGTNHMLQTIDRSLIKQIRRNVSFPQPAPNVLPDCLKEGHVLDSHGTCKNCGMSLK